MLANQAKTFDEKSFGDLIVDGKKLLMKKKFIQNIIKVLY